MKREYDFSKAVRGKFYRPDAKLQLPVYLEADVEEFFQALARRKRSDVSTVVNEILKSDMQLAESLR